MFVKLTFRTIAISLYGKEKRTHSIRSLKTPNRRLAPQEQKLLSLLEDAYLAARYASLSQIESSALDTVFAQVARLLELAETAFEERMGIVSGLKSE